MSEELANFRFSQLNELDKRKNSLVKRHKKDVKYFVRFNYKQKLNLNVVKKFLLESGCLV